MKASDKTETEISLLLKMPELELDVQELFSSSWTEDPEQDFKSTNFNKTSWKSTNNIK